MNKFDYPKEAARLIEFAQHCVENSADEDDTLRRMKTEMKNRREYRRHVKIKRALEIGRYDLVDLDTLREHVVDYPELATIYHKVDPDSCKINFIPNEPFAKSDTTRSKRRNNISSVEKQNQKRQQLVENAKQNTDLVKTLLGNKTYIDLTHSPPTSLPSTALLSPVPAPTFLPPATTSFLPSAPEQPHLNMFDPSFQYQQLNQMGYNNGFHVKYPTLSPFSNSTLPSQNLGASYYHRQGQVPYYSSLEPTPLAPMTSTLLPPNPHTGILPLQQQEQRPAQVSQSDRTMSKRTAKRKIPKSLKKMGNIVKKYDLDA